MKVTSERDALSAEVLELRSAYERASKAEAELATTKLKISQLVIPVTPSSSPCRISFAFFKSAELDIIGELRRTVSALQENCRKKIRQRVKSAEERLQDRCAALEARIAEGNWRMKILVRNCKKWWQRIES